MQQQQQQQNYQQQGYFENVERQIHLSPTFSLFPPSPRAEDAAGGGGGGGEGVAPLLNFPYQATTHSTAPSSSSSYSMVVAAAAPGQTPRETHRIVAMGSPHSGVYSVIRRGLFLDFNDDEERKMSFARGVWNGEVHDDGAHEFWKTSVCKPLISDASHIDESTIDAFVWAHAVIYVLDITDYFSVKNCRQMCLEPL
jgi:hypothetical protein